MNYTIQPLNIDTIPHFVRLRRQMFIDMGVKNNEKLDSADLASFKYFEAALKSKKFFGWLIFEGELGICSGGVVIDQHPPGPDNLSGKIGYIMSISTLPEHRNRGLGTKMMHYIISWLKSKDIRIISLHTTKMAKSIYLQIGFKESNEMVLTI